LKNLFFDAHRRKISGNGGTPQWGPRTGSSRSRGRMRSPIQLRWLDWCVFSRRRIIAATPSNR
jgi:hypothetical protein